MTDDLVKRLRDDYQKTVELCAEAADAIERLTRERDEAHQRYVDANEARIDAEESLTDAYMAGAADARKERDSARVTMSEALRQADAAIARADAAERKVEKLREALKPITSSIYWDTVEIVKARDVLAETEN